jgi:hypothetical protein
MAEKGGHWVKSAGGGMSFVKAGGGTQAESVPLRESDFEATGNELLGLDDQLAKNFARRMAGTDIVIRNENGEGEISVYHPVTGSLMGSIFPKRNEVLSARPYFDAPVRRTYDAMKAAGKVRNMASRLNTREYSTVGGLSKRKSLRELANKIAGYEYLQPERWE